VRLNLLIPCLIGSIALTGCRHTLEIPTGEVDKMVAARNLTRAGKPEKAFERFEEILESEPGNLVAHRGLVEAAYYAGRLDEVAGRYESLAGRSGSEGLGAYGLGLVEVSRGPGHMDTALERFHKAAALMPKEADVPYRIGLILLLNGENQKAAAAIQRAIKLDPNRAAFYIAYGGALVRLGRAREALQEMRRILVLSPTPQEAEKARAISAKVFDPMRGAPPEVAQDLSRVVEYLNQDTTQLALAEAEKILARNPEVPFAYVLKGLAHSRMENNGEAVVAFERALALRPDSPVALMALGDVYARSEKWTRAREFYEKAVTLDPFDAEAHRRMGDLAKARSDFDRAVAAYGILALLTPGDISNQHLLALTLFSAERYREAIVVYEKILEKRPDDLESLVRLGSLHSMLMKRDPSGREENRRRARAYLNKAHELNPENEMVGEMLGRLEE
jgi:protein O-GlcNAc transferase